MYSKSTKALQSYSFWIAVLLHILFFLSVSFVWVFNSEIPPATYVPSYAYNENSSSAAFEQKSTVEMPKKSVPISKNGIQKPVFDTRSMRFNQVMDITSAKNSEPVHLIGDTNKTPKPLIILLGKALTRELIYPRAAIDLTVKGLSVIGFTLHPDGQVTDVTLLKSSTADILDQAALTAARQISPVKNVSTYINEPTPIVFGIVFGSSNPS